MKNERTVVLSQTESENTGVSHWLTVWEGNRFFIANGYMEVPIFNEAFDVRVSGKVEFAMKHYDPTTNDWESDGITAYELSSSTLPKTYSCGDAYAAVTLSADGNIQITAEYSEEAYKGHVYVTLPKITLTKIEIETMKQIDTNILDIMDLIYTTDSDQNDIRKLDIYYPTSIKLGSADKAKAVITIHGGSWSGGRKEDYSHMTPYIIGQGLIHVNMDYRLLKNLSDAGNNGDDSEDAENNDAPYVQMLDDIQMAIKFLKTNATAYRIDTSAIGLMGYSAGGHLAMLYAFSRDKGEGSENTIPVKLVISEAGPTDFRDLLDCTTQIADEQEKNMINEMKSNVLRLCDKGDVKNYNCGFCESKNLSDANRAPCVISPLDHVTATVDQTNNSVDTVFPGMKVVLLYGSGTKTYGATDNYKGDGIVPYSNATDLEKALNGENSGSCQLVELQGTKHGDFCPSSDESGKVYPPLVLTSDLSITYLNALNNSLGYLKNYVLQNA